VESGLAQF